MINQDKIVIVEQLCLRIGVFENLRKVMLHSALHISRKYNSVVFRILTEEGAFFLS